MLWSSCYVHVQEELHKWRELNCAADFVELAASLNPLVQSLPQVLHHQVIVPPAVVMVILTSMTAEQFEIMQLSLSVEACHHSFSVMELPQPGSMTAVIFIA